MLRMKYLISASFSCLALCCAASVSPAQDDTKPLRLERKAKPAEPPTTKPGEKDKEEAKPEDKLKPKTETPAKTDPNDELKTEAPDALEREVQETINRLSKNFRQVEDKLQKKDPGDGTQQVQKDIIKDRRLIDQMADKEQMQDHQNQQQQQQQGQKSSQSSGRG